MFFLINGNLANFPFFAYFYQSYFFLQTDEHEAESRKFPLGVEYSEQIWTEFSAEFAPAVKEVVEFAKRIPNFMELEEEDQIQLMKSGAFEVNKLTFNKNKKMDHMI